MHTFHTHSSVIILTHQPSTTSVVFEMLQPRRPHARRARSINPNRSPGVLMRMLNHQLRDLQLREPVSQLPQPSLDLVQRFLRAPPRHASSASVGVGTSSDSSGVSPTSRPPSRAHAPCAAPLLLPTPPPPDFLLIAVIGPRVRGLQVLDVDGGFRDVPDRAVCADWDGGRVGEASVPGLSGAVLAGVGQLVLVCLHVWAPTAELEVVGVQAAGLAGAVAVLGQVRVARAWVGAECMFDCWVAARVEVVVEYAHRGVCLESCRLGGRGDVYAFVRGERIEDPWHGIFKVVLYAVGSNNNELALSERADRHWRYWDKG